MPDVANRLPDLILGRGLITAEAIYQDVRERLNRELAATVIPGVTSLDELTRIARRILDETEPIFAEHLSNTELAAWRSSRRHDFHQPIPTS